MEESKIHVSVEEMVAALNYASAKANVEGERRTSDGLLDARDYIIAAQSALAERDAEIAELKLAYVPQDVAVECRETLLAAGFGKVGTSNTLLGMTQQACVLIAEMRLVTGPKCPKCDHWLRVNHMWSDDHGLFEPGGSGAKDIDCEECLCIFTVAELLANHPAIAAELGLTPKEPANS